MYEDAFETKFLKATEALYHEEGNRYMQETDVSYHPFYNIQQWELHLLYFAVLSYFSCKKIFTPDKSDAKQLQPVSTWTLALPCSGTLKTCCSSKPTFVACKLLLVNW